MSPSLDDKYRALARSGRSTIWNETIELVFIGPDGYLDPSREGRTAQAVVRAGTEDVTNASGGAAQRWQSTIAAGKTEARIDRASYDGPPIRARDKIQRIERPGQPSYEIRSVNDRDAGDFILKLNESS